MEAGDDPASATSPITTNGGEGWAVGCWRSPRCSPWLPASWPTRLRSASRGRTTAQIVVSGRDGSDRTHAEGVRYASLDPAVARVDGAGVVRPTGDGETEIVIRDGNESAAVRVVVVDQADRRPVRFHGEVVPILTRLGCNAGACHGKASGQNGFRLSLLGSDPGLDHESLVRDGRGRRVFPAAPSSSLMLLKPTAALPHGGGKRLEPGSAEYRTLERWIGQGMPFDPDGEPRLIGLEVRPGVRVCRTRGEQLRAVAHYADGTISDVTRLALFQSNAADVAEVDALGRVSVRGGVGEAVVMARFGGRVAVARVTVPLGADVPAWEPPTPRNLIDGFIFSRLEDAGYPAEPALRRRHVCTSLFFGPLRRLARPGRGRRP